MSAATAKSIRPYIELLVAKAGEAKGPIFALAAQDGWEGPKQYMVGTRFVDVRWCPSELALREALIPEVDPQRALLLLTPVVTLGDDVAARLFNRRVIRPDPEAALIEAFDVRALDAAIPGWLVAELVALAPAEGYERTGARLLDADRAWAAFLRHGLQVEPPGGLTELLTWAEGPGRERFKALDDQAGADVRERLGATVPGAAGILAAVSADRGDDVLAVGLALRLLVDGVDAQALAKGRTHLPYVAGWTWNARDASAWATAAEALLRQRLEDDPAAAQATLQAADRWMERLEVGALASSSDVLSAGLRRRLAVLGEAIDKGVGVEAAAAAVRCHRLAAGDDSAEVAQLAQRLVAWLERPDTVPASFRDAAAAHVSDDAYADLARTVLRYGGGEPTLDAALRRLVARADARREAQEERFAGRLAAWSAHAQTGGELLGVEDVLDVVVAPLATQVPVVVVVLDGTSHRVAVELLEDAIAAGWTELRRAEQPDRALVLAALPSVTTYSRASLLSGRLTKSLAAGEQDAFAEHSALRAANGGEEPRLFHKGEIADAHGGLSAPLRTALESSQRVVGAVINAVDAHLAADDQLRSAWRIRDIVPLRSLMSAARDAGRLVVLCSDHGHILEHASSARSHGGTGGERWAAADRPAQAGEVLVEGPRMLAGAGRALLAWSETVRFTNAKKHGYHGGASAQEVLAPLVVLAPTLPEAIAGWAEAPYDPPAWWTGAQAPAPSPPPAPVGEPTANQQLSLDAPAAAPDWIGRLMASAAYADQRARVTRTPLPDERVVELLIALDARDGTILSPALAQAVGIAPLRLGGTLAALRGLLNYDGYDVLEVDEVSDTVRLRRDVLFEQFEL